MVEDVELGVHAVVHVETAVHGRTLLGIGSVDVFGSVGGAQRVYPLALEGKVEVNGVAGRVTRRVETGRIEAHALGKDIEHRVALAEAAHGTLNHIGLFGVANFEKVGHGSCRGNAVGHVVYGGVDSLHARATAGDEGIDLGAVAHQRQAVGAGEGKLAVEAARCLFKRQTCAVPVEGIFDGALLRAHDDMVARCGGHIELEGAPVGVVISVAEGIESCRQLLFSNPKAQTRYLGVEAERLYDVVYTFISVERPDTASVPPMRPATKLPAFEKSSVE